MINTKKQQKKIVEAFQNDSAAIRLYLSQLKEAHAETFTDDEHKSLEAIDRYFGNLNTWFAGFANGLKG